MPRCVPPSPRKGRSVAFLALVWLGLASLTADARADLNIVQVELAAWIDGLRVTPGATPVTAFPNAEAWLCEESGPADLELARALCRPRYARLAVDRLDLARRLAAADGPAAAALYEERILPTCLEIALCLRAAATAGGERR